METWTLNDILALEKRYRATFINSLTGFKSLNLVGTSNKNGQYNLAPFSQVFHLGAHPPLIGMIVRPDSVARHTLSNLEETGFYTLNHVSERIYSQAHQCSARYAQGQSEFEAVGLTPSSSPTLPAPYVAESPIKIGMEFKERHELSINQTIMVIGQIIEVIFPKEYLEQDGYLDIEEAGTITSSALDSYHRTQRIARLPYAKP